MFKNSNWFISDKRVLEKGLSNMAEATNYDCLNQISPFFSAITDVMCGDENEQETKKLFTEYVEILQCLCKDKKELKWSEDEFHILH